MIARVGLLLAVVATSGVSGAARVSAATPACAGGDAFSPGRDGLTLAGQMVKTQTFLRTRVYAVALYVSHDAVRELLGSHPRRPPMAAFYDDLITRDFDKEIVLRLLREVSEERIRSALRKRLEHADPARVEQLLSYFGPVESGTECTLRWAPGGTLEVMIGGVSYPPIPDRAFTEAVFGIWLGDQGSAHSAREKLVANLEPIRAALALAGPPSGSTAGRAPAR